MIAFVSCQKIVQNMCYICFSFSGGLLAIFLCDLVGRRILFITSGLGMMTSNFTLFLHQTGNLSNQATLQDIFKTSASFLFINFLEMIDNRITLPFLPCSSLRFEHLFCFDSGYNLYSLCFIYDSPSEVARFQITLQP